jgi:hypothetical protein
MKGLKKIALVAAISAVAAGAQAELKALDDSTMSEMTGQKGLTIDLETKWSIGEFAYHDAGLVVLKDLSMGGNPNDAAGNSMLDNIRMEIDIAGSGAVQPNGAPDNLLKYGFSNVKNLAYVHVANGNADADILAAAAGSLANAGAAGFTGISRDGAGGAVIDNEVAYGDGDLKIHFTFTDAWQKAGGFAAVASGNGVFGTTTGLSLANLDYATATDIATRAVDFEFSIGQIALAASAYATDGRLGTADIERTNHVTGLDATADTTTLISDLSIKGYLGPADIHIENKGNGFGKDGSFLGANLVEAAVRAGGGDDAAVAAALAANNNGTGNADSKIHWDSFFKVTDLDVYIDIAGVQLSDIKIHNVRGDVTSLNEIVTGVDAATGDLIIENTASFGFAHSKRDIYAVKDAVLNLTTLGVQTGANRPGYVDGIAINTRFKGDIDIGALSFGDTGTSIGAIYLTDVTSTTNWTISAH